jgi:hypothetical protein
MKAQRQWQSTVARWLGTMTLCVVVVLSGCRRPRISTSQTPELRGPVTDLAAIRAGDALWLNWTMPRQGVNKLKVHGVIQVRICQRDSVSAPCANEGAPLWLSSGATGSFTERLSAISAFGEPHVIYFFVELIDRKGKSTGLSNSVPTLAGAPPPEVQQLSAQTTVDGVLLSWKPDTATSNSTNTTVHVHRVEQPAPPVPASLQSGFTPRPPATSVQDLSIDDNSDQALDTGVQQGKIYIYNVQRVVRFVVSGQPLEMDGPFSPPLVVKTTGGAQPPD